MCSRLSRLTSFGSSLAGSRYYGAGLNAPIDLALNDLENVWAANLGSNSVSEILSTGAGVGRVGLWLGGAGESMRPISRIG